MFREWKVQTDVARAQYLLHSDPKGEKEVDETIANVRAFVVSLRQRGNLNSEDQQIVHELQNKLKSLMKLKRSFVQKRHSLEL